MDRGTVGSANRGRLQVEARTEGRSEVVTPVGELDHHTADLLREPLESAVDQGRARLVVDCSRLDFCDSTGLNVLLGARLKAEAAGEGFTWPRCSPWWRGSSRSRGPRRYSPFTTPLPRPWRPDRAALRRPRSPRPSRGLRDPRSGKGCRRGSAGQEIFRRARAAWPSVPVRFLYQCSYRYVYRYVQSYLSNGSCPSKGDMVNR